VLTLRGSEKHAYERCRDWMRRCGKPLDFIVHEYVEAAEILEGLSVVEAARFYAQLQCRDVIPKTVPDIVTELLDDLTRKGKSKFYIRDLRVRLGAYAKAHECPLNTVSGKEIDLYVSKLKGGARYRNNVLQAIGTLFSFAQSHGYVHPDHEGTSKVTRYEVRHKEVEVFTTNAGRSRGRSCRRETLPSCQPENHRAENDYARPFPNHPRHRHPNEVVDAEHDDPKEDPGEGEKANDGQEPAHVAGNEHEQRAVQGVHGRNRTRQIADHRDMGQLSQPLLLVDHVHPFERHDHRSQCRQHHHASNARQPDQESFIAVHDPIYGRDAPAVNKRAAAAP
jgi:hypothetical protein